MALGRWNGKAVLTMRWNGSRDNPIGNPQSRGKATWFVIPKLFVDAIMPLFEPDKRKVAEAFLRYSLDEIPRDSRKRKGASQANR